MMDTKKEKAEALQALAAIVEGMILQLAGVELLYQTIHDTGEFEPTGLSGAMENLRRVKKDILSGEIPK